MNEKDRLLRTLDLKDVDRAPCVSPLQTGTIDLMNASGAYWPEANHDARQMALLSWAGHGYAGLEGVRVPFDVTVEASTFGSPIGGGTMDRPPAITGPLINTAEDLGRLRLPDLTDDGRAGVVLEAVRILASVGKDVPVICGIVAPFTLAMQLRGIEEALMDIERDPGFFSDILEMTTEWDITYAIEALDAGADVVTLIDAAASGDMIGPDHFRRLALPCQRRMVDAIRKGGGHSILHICGDTTENLSLMVDSGADGISVDQCMDIGRVKEQLKGIAATVGNVDPVSTLLTLGPEDVIRETRRCLDAGTDIIAPGCGFAPGTPIGNMMAMVRAAKDYSIQ